MQRLTKWKIPRFISALTLTLFIYLVFILLVFIVLPSVKDFLLFLLEKGPFYKRNISELFEPLMEELSNYPQEIAKFRETLLQSFGSIIGWGSNALLHILENSWSVAHFLLTLVLSPFIGFYALKDGNIFRKKIKALIPLWLLPESIALYKEIDKTFAGYIRGQLMVSCILMLYYMVCLSLLPLRFGGIIGILSGLISFVPYVGISIGLSSALLMALLQSGTTNLIFVIIIYICGNMLEGMILTPNLIGRTTGIHPIVVLFAVFAGGALKGVTGILLALPITAILFGCFRFFKKSYLTSELYKGKTL